MMNRPANGAAILMAGKQILPQNFAVVLITGLAEYRTIGNGVRVRTELLRAVFAVHWCLRFLVLVVRNPFRLYALSLAMATMRGDGALAAR